MTEYDRKIMLVYYSYVNYAPIRKLTKPFNRKSVQI